MKILITGIHGFVGSNLVRALKERHELYGLDIVKPEVEGVVTTYGWDDLEAGRLPEVDAIIHLAGKAHDVKKTADRQVYFDVNYGLTVRIYDYFLRSGARKFVGFSSVKAAADSVPGDVLTEEVVPRPVGPYGESKIKAEAHILAQNGAAAGQHEWSDTTEKRTYVLRPCMIHGPGNKGNLNLLYGVVRKGIPWPLGAFENRRSFTSIGNLCFVIEQLLTKEVVSGIYNMGDDESLSTNELIEVMCEAMGKKARIWRLPKGLMSFCAKCGDALHLPLNSERLTKLTESYKVSNEKIKKAIGIDKMPISAKDGLTSTIKSFGE
ncbi:MAG: NAD-dependent epimerase/dehydratase family protein [Bacteroidaceae bacterium]|nr:NAD-dependent epimerase/dehydratase family protein [Bacteroidaceae bacterium]